MWAIDSCTRPNIGCAGQSRTPRLALRCVILIYIAIRFCTNIRQWKSDSDILQHQVVKYQATARVLLGGGRVLTIEAVVKYIMYMDLY